MVRPETATETPNKSPGVVPKPASSPLPCQPAAVLVNTYARPRPGVRTDTEGAPTTMGLPEMATASPNPSWAMPPEPASSPVSCQPVAVLVTPYARPKPEDAPATAGAPTTMVLPDTATELPNQS